MTHNPPPHLPPAPPAPRAVLYAITTQPSPSHLPTHRPALQTLVRLHLALFYCYGVFFQLPHRLAALRYISTARPLQK